MSTRDRIGITALVILVALNSGKGTIVDNLVNTPLMVTYGAAFAAMIPRLLDRDAARSRTWGRVALNALLGGIAGGVISLLCRLL